MVLTLSNDLVELKVYPEHGFVISSILHTSHRRNILWNPGNASYSPLPQTELGPAGAESIATFDHNLLAGGWFPMFPNTGPPGAAEDRWMHGEAARLSWNVVEHDSLHVLCTLLTPVSGILLERTVALDGDAVTVTTRAVNRSGMSQRVTFGEHPCFAREVFAGGRIITVPETAKVTSHADPLNATLVGQALFTWPDAPALDGGTADIGSIPSEPDGRHDHLAIGNAPSVLLLGRNLAVALRWDQHAFPFALLWEHFQPVGSPWGGDVFAIEPSSTSGRTFTEAEEEGAVTEVAPGESLSSWMRIEIDASPTHPEPQISRQSRVR